ncbi:MAG: InlB B-repeat-containing protein, partial [Oscillospiraceae bacterium]|nr:InlB B-repeat-containing protein [Oscillospiraceae bacterium]
MSKQFKRLFALLLVLAMVAGLIPTIAFAGSRTTESALPEMGRLYTEEDNEILDNDVFAKIDSVESGVATRLGGEQYQMTEEDYIRIIPQVIEAIESSETYIPGTLQQNGCFLVWETTTGMPCCYDPRTEAMLNHDGTQLSDDQIAAAIEAENAANEAAVRGGTPTSTKIGLIQPYWDSSTNYDDSAFLNYSPDYKAMWQKLYTATGGTGMRYSMRNATIDNVAKTIEECGLVIFDSHGTTDYSGGNGDYTSRANCSYLCLSTNTGVTTADTTAKQGQFGTYYDVMKGSNYAYVSGTAIANHMTKNAPHSLVYMGICLGMATDGMFKGLRNRGVETVWGYSQSVTFSGEKTYMNSILGYVKDGDQFKDAVKKTKDATCWWDPAYSGYTESGARREKAAFPICVSSEDAYPGHGNVDTIQNVYSTWSLYGNNNSNPSYTVTATSNNTSYGTVSINGNVITATPKSGYYAAGYTVTSGTATVTQNGNTFTVTPYSNCTVRINFAAKTQYTVTLKANGSTYTTLSCYSGESVTLPSYATSVSGYTFVGWAANTVYETSVKPTILTGSYTPNGSVTLYAVYSRTQGGTGANVYQLLTSAPANWAGNYVITNGNSTSMYVLKGVTPSSNGAQIESSSNSSAFSSTGMTLSNNTLSNVSNSYVFNVEANGSAYTVKSAATGSYLGLSSSYLAAYTTPNNTYCNWTPAINASGAAQLKNSASGSYPYLGFSTSGKYFWSASATNANVLRLWKSTSSGTTYYTTSPSATTPEPDPEPVTTYTVSFSVPSGVAAVSSQTVAAGNSITLPTAGAPAGYTFLGWTTSTVSNATTKPTTYTGRVTVNGNVTLYALYSYSSTSGGSGTGYELLTSAPADWSGNYIIT